MKPKAKLSLIVATAKNHVIGRDGVMPWRLASDLAHFKRTTAGKPVLMGRKTWESLFVQPLPGRTNLVLSRNASYVANGAQVFTDLPTMIAHARALDAPEIMIIGGGTLYHETLPICDRVYVSQVEADIPGDTFFPQLRPKDWQLVQQTPYPASQKDEFAFLTQIFERR